MKPVLTFLATCYLSLWWHLRVDPTGYVHPAGRILGTITLVVGLAMGTITGLSNAMLGGTAEAADGRGGLLISAQSALARTSGPEARPTDSRQQRQSSEQQESEAPVAASEVPSNLFSIYNEAAASCSMDWEVLAAVGWIESHHGELVAPGVRNGANFAGAQGPMQFLSATWQAYGKDGDGDGVADVYNPIDSVYGAANYLCANGASNNADIRNALWHYNHSWDYVDDVLAIADQYRNGVYALPLPAAVMAGLDVNAKHHSYPAIDFAVPTGTPVYAVHGGRATHTDGGRCGRGVSVTGVDGATYLYCHLSSRSIASGASVSAGEHLGGSGGDPGHAGAGSSTGPHLHLQITVGNSRVCPQPLIQAWAAGQFISPDEAPRSGCSY